ncbi:MAG: hypothetical protein R3325_09155 [Thermoanaerobaculia bacterium]|nr:hypothetical protein [Thermoanaerobaculia bacterium]
MVRVVDLESGRAVAQGRTYTSVLSNPKIFTVPPGRYRVEIGAVRLPGRPERSIEVTVEKAGAAEAIAEFAP